MKRVKEKISVAMSILGSITLFPVSSHPLTSKELRKNIDKISSRNDRESLRADWENIGNDMRISIENYKIENKI